METLLLLLEEAARECDVFHNQKFNKYGDDIKESRLGKELRAQIEALDGKVIYQP